MLGSSMKPPSIIACATVFPFNSTSFNTSSACDGCSTRCSTKNSASCFSVIYSGEELKRLSAHVADSDGDDLVGRSQARQYLAHTVFAQCSHAQFAGSLPQDKRRGALVDHVAHFVVNHKNFEYAHSSFVADLAAQLAADWPHDLCVQELTRLDSKRAQLGVRKFARLFAVATKPTD